MPGSSAEHLNTQNAKGLPLPSLPFLVFKSNKKKKCGVEVGGRKREEAVLTRLKNPTSPQHTPARSASFHSSMQN